MSIDKCKVCGGSVTKIGNYFRCNYCRQVYTSSGVEAVDAEIYKEATEKMLSNSGDDTRCARQLLGMIPKYSDSFVQMCNCDRQEEERRLRQIRDKQIYEDEERRKAVFKRYAICIGIMLAFSAILFGILIHSINSARREKRENYETAIANFNKGNLLKAKDAFDDLGRYEDSKSYIERIDLMLAEMEKTYASAKEQYNSGDYYKAVGLFESIDYKDAREYVEKCARQLLMSAKEAVRNKNYSEAKNLITYIPESSEVYTEATYISKYLVGIELFNSSKYLDAINTMNGLPDSVFDSSTVLGDCIDAVVNQVKDALVNGNTREAETILGKLPQKTIQQTELDNLRNYISGIQYWEISNYYDGIRVFASLGDYMDSALYTLLCADELYSAALVAIENEQYDDASSDLEYLFENVPSYEDAKKTLDDLPDIINDKLYTKAVSAYKGKSYEDAQTMFMQIPEYKKSADYLDKIGTKLLKRAKEYLGDKKYSEFLGEIEKIDTEKEWIQFESAIEVKNNAIESYVEATNTKALEILYSKGETACSEYMYSCENAFYSSTKIASFLSQHKATKCKDIDSIACYSLDQYERNGKDNFGNTYGYVLCGGGSMPDTSYVEYDVSNYSHFCGVGILRFDDKDKRDRVNDMEGVFRIYGDGELLFDGQFNKYCDPIVFSIDISDVRIFRLVINHWRWDVGSYFGIADPVFYK